MTEIMRMQLVFQLDGDGPKVLKEKEFGKQERCKFLFSWRWASENSILLQILNFE